MVFRESSPCILIHIPRIFFLVSIFWFGLGVTALSADNHSGQQYPDVLSAKIHARSADVFDFDVTVSSPYDSPSRYADAFRVMRHDGTVFGERILWHDHAGEQPFTRDLYGVKIPTGIRQVVIQARDQKYGYGGKKIVVDLPGR